MYLKHRKQRTMERKNTARHRKYRVVSDEFWDFCTGLHQDFELYGPDIDDVIKGALGFIKGRRYKVLRDYLRHILATESDDGLKKLYRSTWAEMTLDEVLRPFFERVCQVIETTNYAEFGLSAAERRQQRRAAKAAVAQA